jgi:hypothetical protein
VGGIDIAEGCAAGNLNGAQREAMAELRATFNVALQAFFSSSDVGTARGILQAVAKAGDTVTGNITRQDNGPHIYFADATLTTPKIIYLNPTDPDPSPLLPGMILVTLA